MFNLNKKKIMPVITIEGPVLSLEKKEKLAKEISQLASDIMNIPLDAYVVFIKENPYENMAQGGILISEKLKK
jgi:4-oxalocrotonate tautomerase